MLSTPKHIAIEPIITMGSYNIEVVKNFVYLGSEVTSNNDVSAEINRRIILASRCLGGLRKLMRSKFLSYKTKIQLYHHLIQPVLLYWAESWNIKTSDENILLVFERKILRLIYGPICNNGEWRILYNHELSQRYQHADVVQKIRANRLRWTGHGMEWSQIYQQEKYFRVIQLVTENAVFLKLDGET